MDLFAPPTKKKRHSPSFVVSKRLTQALKDYHLTGSSEGLALVYELVKKTAREVINIYFPTVVSGDLDLTECVEDYAVIVIDRVLSNPDFEFKNPIQYMRLDIKGMLSRDMRRQQRYEAEYRDAFEHELPRTPEQELLWKSEVEEAVRRCLGILPERLVPTWIMLCRNELDGRYVRNELCDVDSALVLICRGIILEARHRVSELLNVTIDQPDSLSSLVFLLSACGDQKLLNVPALIGAENFMRLLTHLPGKTLKIPTLRTVQAAIRKAREPHKHIRSLILPQHGIAKVPEVPEQAEPGERAAALHTYLLTLFGSVNAVTREVLEDMRQRPSADYAEALQAVETSIDIMKRIRESLREEEENEQD